MNWYIDNAGAAEGPYDAAAMTRMAREQRLDSDSLVWHADLEEWQSVAALAPDWWGAALPTHAPEAAPAPNSRSKTAEKAPAAVPASDLPAEPAQAKRRLTAPKAPTGDDEPEKESGGFLKKIFGFGKKKK